VVAGAFVDAAKDEQVVGVKCDGGVTGGYQSQDDCPFDLPLMTELVQVVWRIRAVCKSARTLSKQAHVTVQAVLFLVLAITRGCMSRWRRTDVD
jgi:hypothetical protein